MSHNPDVQAKTSGLWQKYGENARFYATIPKNLTKLRDCRTFVPERSFASAQDDRGGAQDDRRGAQDDRGGSQNDSTYTRPSSLWSIVRILFSEVISVSRES